MKLEHVGIAVADANTVAALLAKLLGETPYKEEQVESEAVRTVFFKTGESKVELLEATDERSVIHNYIEKRGPGLHHLAFAVADIRVEMARLKSLGFVLLNDEPKPGADNKLICFLHPKSTGGVLVELCQEISA